MDNFLTVLYFKLFEITEEEKKLRAIHDFPDNGQTQIRNDQSILGAMKQHKLVRELLEAYLKHLGL